MDDVKIKEENQEAAQMGVRDIQYSVQNLLSNQQVVLQPQAIQPLLQIQDAVDQGIQLLEQAAAAQPPPQPPQPQQPARQQPARQQPAPPEQVIRLIVDQAAQQQAAQLAVQQIQEAANRGVQQIQQAQPAQQQAMQQL